VPYQDRQTFDDEEQAEMGDDAPPQRGASKLVLWAVLAALVAGGIATAFAVMRSP
jgi:hypothetical protein